MRKRYEATWLPASAIPRSRYDDVADILYKNYGRCCCFPEKAIASDYAFRVYPDSFLAEVFIFERPFECQNDEILQIWSVNPERVSGLFFGNYCLYDVGDGTPNLDGRSPGDQYLNVLRWCKHG